MVQAIISIDEHTNRLLNIIKAKYGLKDKSQAIEKMAEEYELEVMEPELRPAYIEKAKKIMKQKTIPLGTIKDFKKMLSLK